MENPKSAAQAVRLGTQKKADVMAKTEECGGRISSSTIFFLLRPYANWMRPTYIMEGNLFYSKSIK